MVSIEEIASDEEDNDYTTQVQSASGNYAFPHYSSESSACSIASATQLGSLAPLSLLPPPVSVPQLASNAAKMNMNDLDMRSEAMGSHAAWVERRQSGDTITVDSPLVDGSDVMSLDGDGLYSMQAIQQSLAPPVPVWAMGTQYVTTSRQAFVIQGQHGQTNAAVRPEESRYPPIRPLAHTVYHIATPGVPLHKPIVTGPGPWQRAAPVWDALPADSGL